ncbi:MAG: Gfo/Idh/MocA family oxidoreductase [Akkermansiaceae bacterium]|nr:Gfo/Idh/MocA family oxidoreductase [Akkermansiaceae bacterium]
MTDSTSPNSEGGFLNRRRFLKQSAGAGLVLAAPNILKAAQKGDSDKLHIALVGFGKQQEVLFAAMKNIPGLYIQAVCDISDYNRKKGMGQIRAHQRSAPKGYVDIDEMLANEKGLDCAVVATPDFWHSPHTVKCLEAGLHVYCEKMMSNTIDGARAMVKAAEASGKLCQIGHQRRSNPRYRYTYEQLINGQKIAGQITNAQAQWNRSLGASQDIGGKEINKKIVVPKDTLNRYGFKDMHEFLNWRLYEELSGGPISDLGAHQIDIFNWFLEAQPKRLYASGGKAYFEDRQHFDNVLCIFDYDTKYGEVRAFYQVLTTTSSGGGFWENFMGTQATIKTAEIASSSAIYRESGAPEWDDLVNQGYLKKKPAPPKPQSSAGAVSSYESAAPEEYMLPGDLPLVTTPSGKVIPKPAHQPHLENFFASVRGQATLNCDARHAFESEAPIFYVNKSAKDKAPIEFTEEQLNV